MFTFLNRLRSGRERGRDLSASSIHRPPGRHDADNQIYVTPWTPAVYRPASISIHKSPPPTSSDLWPMTPLSTRTWAGDHVSDMLSSSARRAAVEMTPRMRARQRRAIIHDDGEKSKQTAATTSSHHLHANERCFPVSVETTLTHGRQSTGDSGTSMSHLCPLQSYGLGWLEITERCPILAPEDF